MKVWTETFLLRMTSLVAVVFSIGSAQSAATSRRLIGNTSADIDSLNSILDRVHAISTRNIGTMCYHQKFESIKVHLADTTLMHDRLRRPAEKTTWMATMMSMMSSGHRTTVSDDPTQTKEQRRTRANLTWIQAFMNTLLDTEEHVRRARFVEFGAEAEENVFSINRSQPTFHISSEWQKSKKFPWFVARFSDKKLPNENFARNPGQSFGSGFWTNPYFSCDDSTWTLSFVAPLSGGDDVAEGWAGFLSFDVDLSAFDIDQCDEGEDGSRGHDGVVVTFRGTHKCHAATSQCLFKGGSGWTRGGYVCRCRPGFFASPGVGDTFNGSLVEVAYNDWVLHKSRAYESLYTCQKCAAGCGSCTDASPCLATYNWTFRSLILAFSLLCALLTFAMMVIVFLYRKVKVFKLASPAFQCITLLGCIIMYLEMVAIFPYLNVFLCIATKWTRNLGFLVTYSALLLKTWRVNLTYRVKSAYKLKLTDKQLLQWLLPILLVMVIYLGAWTLSEPPEAVFIEDRNGLKFKQCHFGWWDHILAFGEFLFLMWGVRVCFNVRNAKTHFDEAKHIRWSIYNIAIVNIVMMAIHVLIFPDVGPDMKYFLGFLRIQMGTTATVILVFGPKFVRLFRGTGNDLDDRVRAKGRAAPMLGISFDEDGQNTIINDVYQENEELKEEIQKLAAQIQFLKIVGMISDNRHLKPKKDGYFSKENCAKHFDSLQRCLQNGMPAQHSQPLVRRTTSVAVDSRGQTSSFILLADEHQLQVDPQLHHLRPDVEGDMIEGVEKNSRTSNTFPPRVGRKSQRAILSEASDYVQDV